MTTKKFSAETHGSEEPGEVDELISEASTRGVSLLEVALSRGGARGIQGPGPGVEVDSGSHQLATKGCL